MPVPVPTAADPSIQRDAGTRGIDVPPPLAPGWSARAWIALSAIALGGLAVGLHLPGQVSYDSSIQLLEAAEGVSRSWNPPFMSALLQALGGGQAATGGFVLLSISLTYAGLVLAVPPGPAAGNLARIVAALLVIGNPVLMLYAGIVWKDVLLGALLCLACGSCIAATSASTPSGRWGFALMSVAALVVAAHVRQQGLVLLPVLAMLPLLAAHHGRKPSPRVVVGWVTAIVLAFLATGHWAAARITHEEGWDRERGLQRILAYDIVGTLALSVSPHSRGMTEDLGGAAAVRRAYDPARVDSLRRVPSVATRFDDVETGPLLVLWRQAIAADPGAYVRHRVGVASYILGFKSLERCLPMHVGVSGSAEALSAAGLSEGVDARGRWMFAIASGLHDTPWFRHWFTVLALLVVAALAGVRRRDPAMRTTLWFALAGIGYAVATTAFAIACDFRYLYPSITIASACAIALIFGMRARSVEH